MSSKIDLIFVYTRISKQLDYWTTFKKHTTYNSVSCLQTLAGPLWPCLLWQCCTSVWKEFTSSHDKRIGNYLRRHLISLLRSKIWSCNVNFGIESIPKFKSSNSSYKVKQNWILLSNIRCLFLLSKVSINLNFGFLWLVLLLVNCMSKLQL